jgi:hypothetical protein
MSEIEWCRYTNGDCYGWVEWEHVFSIHGPEEHCTLVNKDGDHHGPFNSLEEAKTTARALLWEPKRKVEGKKYDTDKTRFDLVDPAFEEALAEVLTYGAGKYGPNNWRGVEPDRYYAALRRHLCAWRKGKKTDKESGLGHLAHCIANLMFLFHYDKEDK